MNVTEEAKATVSAPAKSGKEAGLAKLCDSGSVWVRAALGAWAEDEAAQVAALAPLAVELLGKAVLWRINPALLASGGNNLDRALVALSTHANLESPNIRTVGLGGLLDRLRLVLDAFPVDEKRGKRLAEARNGAVHVGSTAEARPVLLDCLSLWDRFISELGLGSAEVFGSCGDLAHSLREARKTELEQIVADKLARARQRLSGLEEKLGEAAFLVACDELEQNAQDELPPDDFGSDLVAVEAKCPECGSAGRLFGWLEIDDDVDFDFEKVGPGQYEYFPRAIWLLDMNPTAFACNVCRLHLVGTDELAATGLDASRFRVDESSLGDDFNLQDHIDAAYHSYD